MLNDWLRALHIIAMVAWMAGLFYLPRLFVYHAGASVGSELSETLKVMERRLLRFIINPAMIATIFFGVWLLLLEPELLQRPFMHIKLTCVLLLVFVHIFLARSRRAFADDRNRRSPRFYRVLNEVPTVLLAVIVIMIVVRPFS